LLDATSESLAATCRETIAQTEGTTKAWRELQWPGPANMPAGLPFGVKDVIDVRGLATRAGSRALGLQPAAEHDAEVVARMRAAGYWPVGKTHTTEFAFRDAAPSTNPFDAARTPGGSSSGSGAAVGAGQIPVALGTQTTGSICRPAAYCGVAAFKPSTGATPLAGVLELAGTFDTVGTYGLRTEWAVDAALTMLGVAIHERLAIVEARNQTHAPLRIGVPADAFYARMSPAMTAALSDTLTALHQRGATTEQLHFGLDFAALQRVHRRILQYEAYRAHRQLLAEASTQLGAAWRELLLAGSHIAESEYHDDIAALAVAGESIRTTMSGVDVVAMAPVLDIAPLLEEGTGDASLIIPWTYAGTPLSVLPTGLSQEGLPLAIMLAGHRGEDLRHAKATLEVERTLRAAGRFIDEEP
jgi:Asp-tRNA(Asn)/Glu-tRNA(Gln) amidotransferase A subunit family amidase